jgi:hypothetical protein
MSLAAIFVFLLVSALQLLDRYLDLAKKVSADPLPLALCPFPSVSSSFPALDLPEFRLGGRFRLFLR